jgi:hypothetical protein
MKNTQVCSWVAVCRKQKTKVETSSLRTLEIMPKNLKESVRSRIPSLVLWITDLQVSGFSSFRVLVFLLVPLALGFSLTLGFVNHRLTGIWVFLRPVLLSIQYFERCTDFPRTTSPIKAYTWVDCGHNPPFSTIMKVGGGTTVYTCGRCIVFTPVTFWP